MCTRPSGSGKSKEVTKRNVLQTDVLLSLVGLRNCLIQLRVLVDAVKSGTILSRNHVHYLYQNATVLTE